MNTRKLFRDMLVLVVILIILGATLVVMLVVYQLVNPQPVETAVPTTKWEILWEGNYVAHDGSGVDHVGDIMPWPAGIENPPDKPRRARGHPCAVVVLVPVPDGDSVSYCGTASRERRFGSFCVRCRVTAFFWDLLFIFYLTLLDRR